MEKVTLRPLPAGAPGRPVWLHCGAWAIPAEVRWCREEAVLHLPPPVLERLPVQAGQPVGLWEAPGGEHLHLGPLIGLVFDPPVDDPGDPPHHEGLRLLAKGAEAAGTLLILFSIREVDLERRAVLGFRAEEPGTWRRCLAPLPDVIYDRGPYPYPKAPGAAGVTRRFLRKVLEIPFINGVPAFGKWETYQAMRFFPRTRPYVPETVRLEGPDTCAAMLSRHRCLYLKAEGGSRGREVLRVEAPAGPGEAYQVRGFLRGRPRREAFPSLAGLCQQIARWCPGKNWVVQQGIDLAQVDGRRFDLRVVAQKDGQAEWAVASAIVRWAEAGSVATNTSRGAVAVPLDQFLWKHGGQVPGAPDLAERVEELTRVSALALEARFGLQGEVGLDLAVDPAGRLWLLEANPTPFLDPGEGSQHPFAYARWLALRAWAARYAPLAGPLDGTFVTGVPGPDPGGSGP